MDEEVPGVDLRAVEAAVRRALAAPTGMPDAGELQVLGYGEFSLVIGWPAGAPTVACKRLPLFPDTAAAERYREQFETYLRILTERGVQPIPSEFHTVPFHAVRSAGTRDHESSGRASSHHDSGGERIDNRVVGYVVQPVVAAGTLGPDVLRRDEPDPAHPLLVGVTEAVLAVTDERTGFDAQIANWARGHDGLRYLDVTTPLTFDDDGTIEMDVGLFVAAYPWPLRAGIRRLVAPKVVTAYRDPRRVLVDLAANLIKERLERWIPAVLEVANAHVSPGITPREVIRYYRSDAQLWEVMLRLRRADRWWQRNVRRRECPNLLPGHIDR